MSLPSGVNSEMVLERSNVVLEGMIAFMFRGFLPGISPPTEALFCVFNGLPEKVRTDLLGEAVCDSRCDVGFWVYEGDFSISPGCSVRAHLWVVTPEKGAPFLMIPTDASNALVDLAKGISLKRTNRPKVTDLPVVYAAPDFLNGGPGRDWITLWGRIIPRWRVPMPAGGNLPFEVHSSTSQNVHYAVQFVGSIPPNEPLGNTRYIAHRGDRLLIRFNTRYKFSSPSFDPFNDTIDAYAAPAGDEYDFPSVALHEFGHSLGIEHPDPNSSNASTNIMYQSFAPGQSRRNYGGYDSVEITLRYVL